MSGEVAEFQGGDLRPTTSRGDRAVLDPRRTAPARVGDDAVRTAAAEIRRLDPRDALAFAQAPYMFLFVVGLGLVAMRGATPSWQQPPSDTTPAETQLVALARTQG